MLKTPSCVHMFKPGNGDGVKERINMTSMIKARTFLFASSSVSMSYGVRVPHAEDEKDDYEGQPTVGYRKAARTPSSTIDRPEDPFASLAEERIGNMSAVELPHGQEIKRRDKEAYPSGIGAGMKHEVMASGDVSYEDFLQDLEQQRVAKLKVWHVFRQRLNVRQTDSDDDKRYGNDKTGPAAPPMPISKSALLLTITPFILMIAPNVPNGESGKGIK